MMERRTRGHADRQEGTLLEDATFEESFAAHRRRLFGAMCLVTGGRSEAEEITKDAFKELQAAQQEAGNEPHLLLEPLRDVGLTVHIQGAGGLVVRDAGQIVYRDSNETGRVRARSAPAGDGRQLLRRAHAVAIRTGRQHA